MNAQPQRPGKVSLSYIVSVASRLTDRDRQIALDCYEHHVLTTDQLCYLHFSGARTARARLWALYEMRVLDRFRPPWPRGEGSTPFHWILDEVGAHVVAQLHGVERRKLNWRHSTALAIASSSKLRHQVAINEFFARLAHEAGAVGGTLSEWYGERSAHQLFGRRIMPDGYAVVGLPGREPLHVLLELDRATEPAERLRDKATRYATELPQSALRRSTPLIVLAVPTETRARAALAATAGSGAPLIAVVWNAGTSPLTVITRRPPAPSVPGAL